ncbi:MAG: adenosylmethionine--8-amino-7-oxononanoate transaminase [Candidatus Brocadiales bacterium]|nr:adenosylmethionine--8-amino-7-oxononanoate transaminase [Candidatus Bathyanammoxibius amoris]
MKKTCLKETHQLEEWNKAYLWHPFTQMKDLLAAEGPIIIKEAEGVTLRDVHGNEYIDGVSSMWCNIHGHRNRHIDKAVKSQLDKMAHSTLLGLSNVPAVRLAKRLVEITPGGLNKVFYSDNGSTAVEVALKMSFQYRQQTGSPLKQRFIALDYSYHGDTLGAVSAGGIQSFHELYKPLLFDVTFAPAPYCYRCPLHRDSSETCRLACLEKLEEIMKENSRETTALIMEPLVQGAGGMIVHPPGFLKGVRELCDRYDVLLIADEVMTGFGRTGRMFACEHEDVSPDIMCLSKGINGGYMPLAATLATDRIFEAFLGDSGRTFYHGHTYTGHPLGCAAALASLELFEDEDVLEKLQPKIKLLTECLNGFNELESVGDVRQLGLIAGIELVKDKRTKKMYPPEEEVGQRVILEARKRGAFLRPLDDIIVIMPPLSITTDKLTELTGIVYESIEAATARTR